MSYTPINWQTGQTITAEKLNKMDNGWGVQNTQLFSETVTTEISVPFLPPGGEFTYADFINSPSITVTFDGVSYDVQRTQKNGGNYYGDEDDENGFPVFTRYPFYIFSEEGFNSISTETAGTYTVAVASSTLSCGEEFKYAVENAGSGVFVKSADLNAPLEVIIGETTWQEVYDALALGKRVYQLRANISGTQRWERFITFATSDGGYQVRGMELTTGSQVGTFALTADSADGTLS